MIDPQGFDWDFRAGETYCGGYLLDYQGESPISIDKDGVKKSFKEGRLPFLR